MEEEIKSKTKWRFQEVARNPLPNFAEAEPFPLESVERAPLWKSIFSGPLNLGADINELFPETQEVRTQIDEFRKKGGESAKVADRMELMIGKKPTTAQVMGHSLETALWVAPVPLFKGVKAIPALAAIMRGGVYGAAFAGAGAMGEGKKLEEVASRAITGGIIGAPFGLATHGLFKVGLKIPQKMVSSFKKSETIQRLVYPVISRLKTFGKAGRTIAERFHQSGVDAKRKMGVAMLQLNEAGLVEVPRLFPWQKKAALLSTDLAWKGKNSLLDTLVGKSPVRQATPAVQEAFRVSRKVLNEIISSADDAAVAVGKRQNYFTHFNPSPEKVILSKAEKVALKQAKTIAEREAIYLQSNLKESIRRDILENAVFKQGAFRNVEEGGRILESWAQYVQGGKRVIDKQVRPFLDYVVKKGQAKNLAQAEAKAFKDFIRRPLPRLPKYGPLEYSREIDLPFWDPDPRRVLPTYTIGAITRIEAVQSFGPRNETLNQLIRKVGTTKGVEAAREVDKLVRTITGQIRYAPASEKISMTLRAIQTPKLAFAQILNIGQNINVLLNSDLGALSYGLQSAFTNKGIQKALKSGAILQSVLQRELSYAGGGLDFANKVLKYSGFTWTELFNRTVSANAGMRYAEKTFEKLKKNPTNQFLRWRLKEMQISPAQALKRGTLIEAELLRAGNMMSMTTQFVSQPLYLPAWASSPEGKVIFQFKNFAYNQARFVKNQLFNPHIPLARKARTLLILSMVYPMSGEVLGDVRAMVTGVKRPTNAWDRYWSNIATAGTFGLALDVWESARFGGIAETIGGPTLGTVAEVTENFVRSVEKGEPTTGFIKSLFRQTGVLRPVGNYLYPTKRKNMGSVLEFWEDL